MKKFISSLLILIPLLSYSQHDDIAPGWKKEKDRIKINTKMDELINRISFETGCDQKDITYIVLDKYSFYGTNRDHLNFPKNFTVKACGNTLTYINQCPPNSYGKVKEWVDGKWILIPSSEEE